MGKSPKGISKAFHAKGGSYAVLGLKDVKDSLNKLSKDLRTTIILDALRVAGRPMLDRVRSLTPVRSGDLRRAIRVVIGSAKDGRVYYRVVINKRNFVGDQFYGAIQEYGSEKLKAKRFMRRGFQQTKSQVERNTERLIAEAVQKAARG